MLNLEEYSNEMDALFFCGFPALSWPLHSTNFGGFGLKQSEGQASSAHREGRGERGVPACRIGVAAWWNIDDLLVSGRPAFGRLMFYQVFMKLCVPSPSSLRSHNASVMLCQVRHDEVMMERRSAGSLCLSASPHPLFFSIFSSSTRSQFDSDSWRGKQIESEVEGQVAALEFVWKTRLFIVLW